jgi:hypothetical protein
MRLIPNTSTEDRVTTTEVVLLWLGVTLVVAWSFWSKLDDSFGSTDNLMRLVQVRALLDGWAWFDPHEPRLAPPLGYDTHWSRLIDAGIAALIMALRAFFTPDLAERLARCAWPLLLSGPAVFAVIAIAVRLGGPGAGRAVLVPALLTPALLPTFRPGEIDHHNAQVMVSLVLIACALWSNRPRFAALAGLAAGALLAVGLEAAYVVVAVAAAFGILAVRDPVWHGPARDFGAALGASTLVSFLLVTPAVFRFTPQCDALAVNSAAAVTIGAAGLAGIGYLTRPWSRIWRLLAFAAAGVLAVGVYVAIEPRCLRGPFGLIDRSIFPLWLDHVQEMQPLSSLIRTQGLEAAIYIGFPLVASLAVLWVAVAGLRTPLAWALVASFAIAELIMIRQIRIIIYVFWFGLPFIGVAAELLGKRTSYPALVRIFAAVLASPVIVSATIALLASQSVQARDRDKADQETSVCYRPENYHRLAALPRGVVLGPLDLGPSVLAHTQHSVMAAPYHRIDRAIRFNQEVMDGPSATARERVAGRGIDYVISCTGYRRRTVPGSFDDALLAATSEPWLEPLAIADADIIRIWRVVH